MSLVNAGVGNPDALVGVDHPLTKRENGVRPSMPRCWCGYLRYKGPNFNIGLLSARFIASTDRDALGHDL